MVRRVLHFALEHQYCVQKMHFWRPTPSGNTYLLEHFDQVSAKSTGRFWIYLYFTFLQWEQTKIFVTLSIYYFFSAKNITKNIRKKYNIAKVVNILVYSHCKK